MGFFTTIAAVRILFCAGLALLVTAILLMLSCRCVPARGLAGRIRKASWFQGLFKRHCILWTVFVIALAVHLVFVLGFLGIPF